MAMIQFSKCPVQDPKATIEAGKPMFGEGIDALIQIDKYSNIRFQFMGPRKDETEAAFLARVPNEIRVNWMPQLNAWLSGQTMNDGTPLEIMAWITPAQVANLRGVGIASVEALAAASDGILAPLGMNASAMRSQAKAWLDERAGKAISSVGRLEDENQALKGQLAEQAEALKAMQEQLAAMAHEDTGKRGPGRPKSKE